MKNSELLPQSSGIYMIKNLKNGHIYIGQSKNIRKRYFSHHRTDFLNEKNCCFNTKIYQALRKYGLENFEISVIEECSVQELDKKETYWIGYYNSYKNGYNSTEGGQNWSENIHSLKTEEKRAVTRELNQSLKGENHPRAKLTNEQVISIRERYIQGESIKEIYEDYTSIYSSINTFKRIVLGKTYQFVGNIPVQSQVRHTNAKLTDAQIKEIRKRYEKGKISYDKLGKEYGICGSAIANIVTRKTYKHIE